MENNNKALELENIEEIDIEELEDVSAGGSNNRSFRFRVNERVVFTYGNNYYRGIIRRLVLAKNGTHGYDIAPAGKDGRFLRKTVCVADSCVQYVIS